MTEKDLDPIISPDERRESERKRLIVDVQYNGGDATGIAATRDIGIGGLYMTTKAELQQGAALFLRMTIGDKDVSVSGVVAYSDPGQGVGIRFHNLPKEIENLILSENM